MFCRIAVRCRIWCTIVQKTGTRYRVLQCPISFSGRVRVTTEVSTQGDPRKKKMSWMDIVSTGVSFYLHHTRMRLYDHQKLCCRRCQPVDSVLDDISRMVQWPDQLHPFQLQRGHAYWSRLLRLESDNHCQPTQLLSHHKNLCMSDKIST